MKTLLFIVALTFATSSIANTKMCRGQARMAEDIAQSILDGLPADKINFVDPADPFNEGTQARGNLAVEWIKNKVNEGLTPKEIRNEWLSTCLSASGESV